MATGIPTCEFETRLDFSLYSERMVDRQVAPKPFDVHEEEGVGSCFLEEYGALGSIKEETIAKEMSVFCTHYISVNNESREFGGFEWT